MSAAPTAARIIARPRVRVALLLLLVQMMLLLVAAAGRVSVRTAGAFSDNKEEKTGAPVRPGVDDD